VGQFDSQMQSTFDERTQKQLVYCVNPNAPIENQFPTREATPSTSEQV